METSTSINQIGEFLASLRHTESSGNYTAEGPATRWGTATGAYQFIDDTWGGYAGYERAMHAPPEVQDARAHELVTEYFFRFDERWDAVAVAWHGGPGAARDFVAGDLDPSTINDGLSDTQTYANRVVGGMGEHGSVDVGSLAIETAEGNAGLDIGDDAEIDPADLDNGQLTDDLLTPIAGDEALLRGAPANSWLAMVDAAAADGVSIEISDAYRPLHDQERLARELGLYSQGGLAAQPGTSNHGLGLAVDIARTDETMAWMTEHASHYGWVADVPREPWHFEYRSDLDVSEMLIDAAMAGAESALGSGILVERDDVDQEHIHRDSDAGLGFEELVDDDSLVHEVDLQGALAQAAAGAARAFTGTSTSGDDAIEDDWVDDAPADTEWIDEDDLVEELVADDPLVSESAEEVSGERSTDDVAGEEWIDEDDLVEELVADDPLVSAEEVDDQGAVPQDQVLPEADLDELHRSLDDALTLDDDSYGFLSEEFALPTEPDQRIDPDLSLGDTPMLSTDEELGLRFRLEIDISVYGDLEAPGAMDIPELPESCAGLGSILDLVD